MKSTSARPTAPTGPVVLIVLVRVKCMARECCRKERKERERELLGLETTDCNSGIWEAAFDGLARKVN